MPTPAPTVEQLYPIFVAIVRTLESPHSIAIGEQVLAKMSASERQQANADGQALRACMPNTPQDMIKFLSFYEKILGYVERVAPLNELAKGMSLEIPFYSPFTGQVIGSTKIGKPESALLKTLDLPKSAELIDCAVALASEPARPQAKQRKKDHKNDR